MKKKTKKLIENIRKAISNTYPFLEESEQKEIFENFVYRSLLNEIIDLKKHSQVPYTPTRPLSIFSNDPMEVATAIGLKANMDPRKVLLVLQNPEAANPADLSAVQRAIRTK